MRVVQDVWHGESSELGKRFLAKRMIQCIITDPPFGVDNQSNSSVTPDGKKYARKIMNDETPEIAMASFEKVMQTIIPAMKDDSDIYVFTAHQVLEQWLEFTRILFQPYGFTRKAIGMWIKDGPGQGDLQTWGMGCEFILYYKRGKRPGGGKRTNLIFNESQVRPAKLIHPHEKPLELLWKLAQHSTSPGDLLVDPYGGSGSLARMCRLHERSGVSIEGDEMNYKLAKQALDEMEVPLI